MRQYQHGDFLLEEIASIPKGAKKLPTNVFGEGEITGHTHRVEGGVAAVLEKDGELFISVSEMALLVHEEHNKLLRYIAGKAVVEDRSIDVAPGAYRVIKQREYDPYERVVRDVQD